MSRTLYAVQHKDDHRWWQGGERWTAQQADARTFEFMADAYMTVYSECFEAPTDYVVVAVRGQDPEPVRASTSQGFHLGAVER